MLPTSSVDIATLQGTSTPRTPTWEKQLSPTFWVNSVAVSNDGMRVVAGTFLHDYGQRTGKFLPNVQSRFGVYCFDESSEKDENNAPKEPLWKDEFEGWDGVFGVAISGDGKIAAAAGWLEETGSTFWGLLRAYDANARGDANTKTTLLLDYSSINRRVSWVGLSRDGGVLAAAADDVYVFFRDGKAFNPIPARLGVGGLSNRSVTNVAVHPRGDWLVACDMLGNVYLAMLDRAKRTISSLYRWSSTALENSPEIPFLSVAIASDADTFVAGGGNWIFHFNVRGIQQLPGPDIPARLPLRFDTTDSAIPGAAPPDKKDGRLEENVRWIAISADGSLVTAVANRRVEGKAAGLLLALTPGATELIRRWVQLLKNTPNAVSVDAQGHYIAVSDGYPPGKPAKFAGFNPDTGQESWHWTTHNMNWPIVVSADSGVVVAGSNDGKVYYFKPTESSEQGYT
jgi:hypothetical protein